MQKNTTGPRRLQVNTRRGAATSARPVRADGVSPRTLIVEADAQALHETPGGFLLVTNCPQVRVGRRWREYANLGELAALGIRELPSPRVRMKRTAHAVSEAEAVAWAVESFLPERFARHVPKLRRALVEKA